MDWIREIDELHEFFERYFLGLDASLDRAASVFAGDLSFVGPDGVESDRTATLAMIEAGHAHTSSLTIRTVGHRSLVKTDDLIVARYVEEHDLTDRTNRRLSTVVFRPDPATPNGVAWVRVHETWLP